MLNPFILEELTKFIEQPNTIETLKEMLRVTKGHILYEETNLSTSFGHSLSNYQIDRLEFTLSESKKRSVGKYLRKLAIEKGLPPVNDATFGEALINRSYWSRLINDKLPAYDKNKLIRIANFFRLNLQETLNLLNKAGFTLSEDNRKDLVVTFFIEQQLYDLSDIEEILEAKKLRSLYESSY
jgi:hypothetical protein